LQYISTIFVLIFGFSIAIIFGIYSNKQIMKFLSELSLNSIIAFSYLTGFSMMIFAILGIISICLKVGIIKTIFSWIYLLGMILSVIFWISILGILGYSENKFKNDLN